MRYIYIYIYIYICTHTCRLSSWNFLFLPRFLFRRSGGDGKEEKANLMGRMTAGIEQIRETEWETLMWKACKRVRLQGWACFSYVWTEKANLSLKPSVEDDLQGLSRYQGYNKRLDVKGHAKGSGFRLQASGMGLFYICVNGDVTMTGLVTQEASGLRDGLVLHTSSAEWRNIFLFTWSSLSRSLFL